MLITPMMRFGLRPEQVIVSPDAKATGRPVASSSQVPVSFAAEVEAVRNWMSFKPNQDKVKACLNQVDRIFESAKYVGRGSSKGIGRIWGGWQALPEITRAHVLLAWVKAAQLTKNTRVPIQEAMDTALNEMLKTLPTAIESGIKQNKLGHLEEAADMVFELMQAYALQKNWINPGRIAVTQTELGRVPNEGYVYTFGQKLEQVILKNQLRTALGDRVGLMSLSGGSPCDMPKLLALMLIKYASLQGEGRFQTPYADTVAQLFSEFAELLDNARVRIYQPKTSIDRRLARQLQPHIITLLQNLPLGLREFPDQNILTLSSKETKQKLLEAAQRIRTIRATELFDEAHIQAIQTALLEMVKLTTGKAVDQTVMLEYTMFKQLARSAVNYYGLIHSYDGRKSVTKPLELAQEALLLHSRPELER